MAQAGRRNGEHRSGGHRVAGSDRPVAHIDQARCDHSASCPVNRICPREAVVPDSNVEGSKAPWFRSLIGNDTPTTWTVSEDRCTGCLLCAQYCPQHAVLPRERQKAV
jgi:Fe-S-cluster-containing hydrogenase component 2